MPVRCSLGHENPDGSAFCDECGEPLNVSTPTASAQAPVHTRGRDRHPGPFIVWGSQSCRGSFLLQLRRQSAGSPATVNQVPAEPASLPIDNQVPAAAGTALQARLIVEADNQEFDISGKDNILIGREDAVSNIFPDVDLTPHGGEEGGVSRMHARIFFENGQYMIEDENSTNFTFLNRQRLAAEFQRHFLITTKSGFGRVLLRFKTP